MAFDGVLAVKKEECCITFAVSMTAAASVQIGQKRGRGDALGGIYIGGGGTMVADACPPQE